MAAKRNLSAQDQQSLREVLQAATIAALMNSRRWEPGDIAFQGGTCLHMAYGSARFSEDLDFMIRGGLSMEGLSKEVHKWLRLPADTPADLKVSVTSGKDERNPHMFYVTLSGPNVIGSAKVKIELWQTQESAMKDLQIVVSTVASPAGQAFVPTLTLEEIFADKVYALGGRERIKPRDVYDLWWLNTKHERGLSSNHMLTRLAIYPVPSKDPVDTAVAWLENAGVRLNDIKDPNATAVIMNDLKRWLPSSWPIDMGTTKQMQDYSAKMLEKGIVVMNEVLMDLIADKESETALYERDRS